MADILIVNGNVVTMDPDRRVVENGAIAIENELIIDVGESEEIEANHRADIVIDAEGHAVIPGLINTHTHVADILFRGGGQTDRALYDWLFNVTKPGRAEMNAEEHAIASALYCSEAIESGITTFVENAIGGGSGYSDNIIESKLEVYSNAGMRNIYCQSFIDETMESHLGSFVRLYKDAAPDIKRGSGELDDTEESIKNIESLIQKWNGSAEGRQGIWPGPLSPRCTTTDGLQACYSLAEEYDVMTTTHVSETFHEELAMGGGHFTMTEYMNVIGCLGERSLFGHCCHLNESDIRLMQQTDARVAHNVISNLMLGSGVAPIPTMLNYGVTVGIGTDNTSCSDTVNMINDMRYVASLHKGVHADSTIMTPEKALEMATIDGARAIGLEKEIGSIEIGKKADIVLINMNYTHFQPIRNVVSAIVYQAQGFEVDTVICNGKIIMNGRNVEGISSSYPDLYKQAKDASEAVIKRTGLDKMVSRHRPWKSVGHVNR
jgi:5-methylthioadenosine/S-adenosylhomocysteine deaminase